MHLATWIVGLGRGASYRAFQLTAGTALARNTLLATFEGERAKLDISGCFLGRGSEHIDTTLVVDHAVPAGESRELIKGVLADRARSVFQGKVIVRPDAQKSDGKQMAQALMLSEHAEFDCKPELEIHADDVICGHGATSAEIDRDMLFYLQSRGISLPEARALLIESFVGEVFDKLASEPLRSAIWTSAKARLASLLAGAAAAEDR
jgi:Fe-S cluster assembly protein SufD